MGPDKRSGARRGPIGAPSRAGTGRGAARAADSARAPAPDPADTRVPAERRIGLARALSKRGICSRRAAEALIRAGRVRLDGVVARDPQAPTRAASRIELDGSAPETAPRVYVLLNKPRGLVTTAADERGRETVYRCLADADLPWLAPVGRLDQASEGLLLFTNDSEWAAALLAPGHAVPRRYHVQVAGLPDAATLTALRAGVRVADGETLAVAAVGILRSGQRNAWLEVTLDEGRNRHLRRLLAAVGHPVLRLVRVALGPLALGDLPKGAWRLLDPEEVRRLAPSTAR